MATTSYESLRSVDEEFRNILQVEDWSLGDIVREPAKLLLAVRVDQFGPRRNRLPLVWDRRELVAFARQVLLEYSPLADDAVLLDEIRMALQRIEARLTET